MRTSRPGCASSSAAWSRTAGAGCWSAGRPPPAPRPCRPSRPPSEETVLLVAALRRLPFEQRQAVVLYHLLDRSLADIAAETGANLNTVKTRLTRGRTALATLLTLDTATDAGGTHVRGV
ncbi:RNA polymerase sigma factor [Dactylosporangium sp. NPDC051541]|uniref:RNA polymerase sigma factor n=1 Tax=Dactylosporangium sp. NPDC051541 TaxID=3363977 RepID=UPI0037BB19F7